jgi:hypothetical protein
MKGDLWQKCSGQPSRPWRGNSIVDRTSAYPREESHGVETAPAESEERLAILSSLTTIGICSWYPDTDQVWTSKNARSLLGLDESTPLVPRFISRYLLW